MAKLEKMEKVSKADKYQSMLDSIVEDMLNKQRRRQQRRREIQQLRKTMQTLDEKAGFLSESMKSYHDYIESCMAQLNKKKYYLLT
jgi:chromosome segregation ATPase